MRHGIKSDLLSCLPAQSTVVTSQPHVQCVILDGAALVQMLKPSHNVTFSEYASSFRQKHVQPYLDHAFRVDVVFDVYKADSLKAATRLQRGHGFRQRLAPSGKVPRNWPQFLRNDQNKTQLFAFLAEAVTMTDVPNKCVVATTENSVLTSTEMPATGMSPCTHEEADTRMLLHALDASESGLQSVLLRTVDTDVVVISIASFHKLKLDKLWIAFGTGKHFRYLAVHEIVNTLGPDKSTSLLLFHALTGCDTVSAFSSKGKKSAYETWTDYPALTAAFLELSVDPASVSNCRVFNIIQRFVVLLYERTSAAESVDVCRKHLFAQKGKSMESIPPTADSLLQHAKRACFQAVHIWQQCVKSCPSVPSPGDWGWVQTGGKWSPLWMTLPQASEVCSELLKCGCKKGCTKNCRCHKAFMKCTSLCYCSGECGDSAEHDAD